MTDIIVERNPQAGTGRCGMCEDGFDMKRIVIEKDDTRIFIAYGCDSCINKAAIIAREVKEALK